MSVGNRFKTQETNQDLRPVYSDATQLNSRSSWVASAGCYRHLGDATPLDVELSCVAIDTLTDATQLSQTIANATDPVEQRTASQREAGLSCFCLPSNFSLQNSISRQTRQNTSYMTSWLTNWVNWVTTFRTDRWQLFTLWTRRQLDVELSWVASASL